MSSQHWSLGATDTSYLRALLIAATVLALVLGTPLFGPLIATPLAVVIARYKPFRVARRWPIVFGVLQGGAWYAAFVMSEWRGPLSLLEWALLGVTTLLFTSVGAALHLAIAFAVFSATRSRQQWSAV